MKAKAKASNPVEFLIAVENTNFDNVRNWLNKAIGFIDCNGKVTSSYTIELSIKESLVPKPIPEEKKP